MSACMGFPTTQRAVLDAFVEKIRATVDEFSTEETCFLSTHPDVDMEERKVLFCVVSPMTGDYDEPKWSGGGPCALIEHTGIKVTVWNAMALDREDESTAMLYDEARGMLQLKVKLLKGLLNTLDDSGIPGNLQDDEGHNILTRGLVPQHAGHPNMDETGKAEFHLIFEASFRWDLS